ncbi:SAM-dependent methyltransferase [Halioglobus maricola]|uniref:SAM-dependent methyltransferase n=1 Tax=Halioglobus maricola TaxID=2601894 RepID=UPI00147883FE|nr:SAM-dependent methyltransferase [Halioglobus maricola]
MSDIHDEQLIVVGTGIRATGQLTIETIAWIRAADKVLYITADPVAEEVIRSLNPDGAESLMDLYGSDKLRLDTYADIVERTMAYLHQGHRVCMAVYGHPGVLAMSTHEAVRRARAEGFSARMLPAVSAADCLYADLGVDEFGGCISYEATDFLLNMRAIDPACHLILWQIGGVGVLTYETHHYPLQGLERLTQKLMAYYGPNHPVTLYEAPQFAGVEPIIGTGPLCQLPHSAPTPNATMYIPPLGKAQPDVQVQWELGMQTQVTA